MSKEHYCYKIHALLMKSVFTPLCRQPPQYGLPPPQFLQENNDPPPLFF